jgi:predicted permease
MQIISTIIPIFTIILLGWIAHRKGFLEPDFIAAANRLVYYLAIPALVFKSIAKASFTASFNLNLLAVALVMVVIACLLALALGRALRYEPRLLAVFAQNGFHGNLGYVGLAVSFYYLGSQGLVRASIIAGFMMILQNALSVTVLQMAAEQGTVRRRPLSMLMKILGNPVIISAILGIGFSVAQIPLPLIFSRSLDILSGLALPMALLIIGASLSFKLLRSRLFPVIAASAIKLVVLPGLGYAAFHMLGMSPGLYLPALILLASPSATVIYVMAKEMNGDTDFAVAAISASTLLSALTFTLWLQFAS